MGGGRENGPAAARGDGATPQVLELWWWSFLKDPPHIEGGTGVFFKGSFKTFLGTYAS